MEQAAHADKVLALGRRGSADDVAALMSDLGARGSEAAQWFTAMLSALEASRTEVAALQEQIYHSVQSPSRKAALDSPPRSGGHQSPLGIKDSNRKLQQRNRQLVRELRDYERYKDVVESTIMRLKDEMHTMSTERERMVKQKKRDEAQKRKLRHEVAAAKKQVDLIKQKNDEIKKQMARTRAELGKQRKQLLAKTTRAEALKETASSAAELLVGQLEARKDAFAKELQLERETLERWVGIVYGVRDLDLHSLIHVACTFLLVLASTQNALEKALRDKGRTAEILEEVQAELEQEKAKSRKLARKLEEASRVAAATADVKLKEAHATIQYLRGEVSWRRVQLSSFIGTHTRLYSSYRCGRRSKRSRSGTQSLEGLEEQRGCTRRVEGAEEAGRKEGEKGGAGRRLSSTRSSRQSRLRRG